MLLHAEARTVCRADVKLMQPSPTLNPVEMKLFVPPQDAVVGGITNANGV